MRPLTPGHPLRFAILAVALSILAGCDQEPENERKQPAPLKLSEFGGGGKKDFKPGKDLEKSADQVRNEALEQVNKNLEKRTKAAEEEAKNQGKEKKKDKDKDKAAKDDPRMPKAFSFGNTPFVELDPETKKKKSDKAIPLTPPANTRHFAEIIGPGQKSVSSTGDTVNIPSGDKKSGQKKGANDKSDAQVVENRGTAELGDEVTFGKKEEKQGFFARLFGIKKEPETRVIRQGEAGKQFEIINEQQNKKTLGQVTAEKYDGTQFSSHHADDPNGLKEKYNPFSKSALPNRNAFTPAPAEKQGLESERVAGEMTRIRLKNEAAAQGQKEPAGKDAGAGRGKSPDVRHPLTDFDPPTPNLSDAKNANVAPAVAPKTPTAPATGAVNPAAPAVFNPSDNAPITADSPINTEFNPAKFATPENAPKDTAAVVPSPAAKPTPDSEEGIAESQRQFGSLEDYRKGLATRDIVAREAAFQRAAAEKREDAVPALVDEVSRNGMLAVTAARVLAVIGKVNDPVERGLMTGLNTNGNKDAVLREACAESLGQLRIRRAVPLLAEKSKLEKSYTVRSACVAALGVIGDPAALPALHMRLDDRGEIEFVKQSAALALARFGDAAGREHLIQSLDSPSAAYQVLGLTGLAQLKDPGTAGYLVSGLDSKYEEVWTTAVMLFPRIGARFAVPILRAQLLSGNDSMRVRASLALGFLGCSDGLALICRAARSGSLQERTLACELFARLGRTDQIPLLMDKLSDPNTNVRQTAATALTRLDAKEAVPLLAEAARGRFKSQLIQPIQVSEQTNNGSRESRSMLSVQTGSPADMNERLIMLACLRILRGEKDDLVLNTLPSSRDSSWPEFDRELLKQQVDLIKMYKLVDVIPSGAGGAGALILIPGGQEILYRRGETLAGGFKIGEISLGAPSPDGKRSVPPFATLQRGDERVILYQGLAPEVENRKDVGKLIPCPH